MLGAMTTPPPVRRPDVRLDLESLYAESLPRVYAFAYRMLGDREAALDATQESFARALPHAESFRGESAPLTWLLSIARNVCLKGLRARPERTFDDLEAIIGRYAEEPSPLHSLVERDVYAAEVREGCLLGLLQCLSFAQRCVFVLHLLNDLPVARVAVVLGRSENAVRVLLSRARSRMRAFLCANCALLGGTRCSCANMIEFSLRRDLIERYRAGVETAVVRDELRRLADEVELYRSLREPDPAIARLIDSGRFAIFAGK